MTFLNDSAATSHAEIPTTNSGPARISRAIVAGVLRVLDASIILATGLITHAVYLGSSSNVGPSDAAPASYYQLATIAGTFLAAVVFHLNGLYKTETIGTSSVKLTRLSSSWVGVILSLVVLGYAIHMSELYSRAWLLLWSTLAFTGMGTGRVVLWTLERRWMKEGRLSRRVAIVGGGRHAARLMEALTSSPLTDGISVMGYFDDEPESIEPTLEQTGCRRLGRIDDLVRRARAERIDQIVVALPWSAEHLVMDVLRRLSSLPIDIQLAPDLVGFHITHSTYTSLGGVPLLEVFKKPLADWRLVWKELEDRVIAMAAILALAPLLLFIALIIKLDSPGPVFFRQQRYGFNNRLIAVLKFRSMYHHMRDETATKLATRNDPRVTRIGGFLRRTSLDELPQLFNVLMGDMSIVGPRPHATSAKAADRLYEEVVAEYAARHRVRPGITGWAQVNGWRGETDTYEKIQKRVEHDLYYIENWSPAFDLKIMLMTVAAVFRPQNAY